MKIGNSLAYYSSQIIRSARSVMLFAPLAFGSLNVNASSVPMLFNFDKVEFSGTFSFDSATEISFPVEYPGITAYDVDALEVTYLPSNGVSSSWNLAEASLNTDERIAVFFDGFGGGAIGATTGSAPAFDRLDAIFIDTAWPFSSHIKLDFSSSLDDSSGNWKIVQGATRVLVGGGTDRSFYTVSQVPLPAAVWLFTSGLIGLIGFARRRA